MQSSCHEQHIKWTPELKWTFGIFSDCVWGTIVQLRFPAKARLCTCCVFDPDLRKSWERVIDPDSGFVFCFSVFQQRTCQWFKVSPPLYLEILSNCFRMLPWRACRIIRFLSLFNWYQPDISPPLCVLLAQTCTHFPFKPQFLYPCMIRAVVTGAILFDVPSPSAECLKQAALWADEHKAPVPRMGSWPARALLIGCFPCMNSVTTSDPVNNRQTTGTTLQQLDFVLWCAEVPGCWYCSAL